MRKLILAAVLILPVFAVMTSADEHVSTGPGESFGYSSDDFSSRSSYLGVDTRDVTPDRLTQLHLKDERGVEVTMVDQDAPAGKAGVKEHDVILSINGSAVESVEQLRRMIHEIPPGRVVEIGISRNGQQLTLKTQLAERSKTVVSADGKNFKFTMPPLPTLPSLPELDVPVSIVMVHSSMRSGLMIENLTPQLGEFFGAKNGQGILVRSVEKGSRAEKAGFRAGDVIIRVNGETIADSGDFSHALSARKQNTASVTIIRDKKEQNINLALPEAPHSRLSNGDLKDESSRDSAIEDETRREISAAESEIEEIKPELEAAAQQMKLAEIEEIKPALENMRPEIERATKDLCKQKVEIEKEVEQMKQELHERAIELGKEFTHPQAEI
ncbi:MAG: PDZ domain-containing protein [Acidobacteriales bacterium]|nr:PDZ domain-containing protein [Terriglobales bacterium]